LGFFAGRYTTMKWFGAQFETISSAEYLGPLLNDNDKKAISKAYFNSDSVYQIIDDIAWSVPNTPTPFVGNAPTPGVHGVAEINAMQFRSKNELIMPKPKKTFRIFITGGSTAFGSGAPSNEQTIGGFLMQILNAELANTTGLNYEVFTLANPAWASTHERIIIENRLSELDPDMVISFSGNNDVHWGLLGRNILWYRSYADEFYLDIIKKSYELNNKEKIREVIKVEEIKIPPSKVAYRLMKNVQIGTFSLMEKEIVYVYFLQPTIATTGKTLTNRELVIRDNMEYFEDCYLKIDSSLSAYQAQNFTFVNLSGVFDKLTDQDEIFVDSYHFGDIGNSIVADSIYSNIKSIILSENMK
jgi:hypothetical protein